MVSEEIILDRDRVHCMVLVLTELLKVESHFQFKLRFSNKETCETTLTIVPHCTPVEIKLESSR